MNGILLKFRRLSVALVFLLGAANASQADQTDPRLDALFEKLRIAEVFSIAHATEQQIWIIWHEAPEIPEVAEIMEDGLQSMRESRLGDALEAFDKAVRRAPTFAEAWNKRATINFLLGDYPASIADVRQTLALEPRHFGALSGLGLINLKLDRKADALAAFEAALEIHPFLPVRFEIDALRKAVEGEKI
ncbi:tetratricopeptide repeat protein [Thalassobaculum litoreum]|uniref:TPR repeat-containing protein n=1 Tax=Thalassobaculum litoreum DSM 18839 TaxID=1123362 RepID=A0A8G2BIV4_9PROT|nr:tetratricopeptide repeat protein [Thalassobaculum litoreum]SDF94896.1 TPR repeat-containing protein [Thalassobaculum litoreum DSM 18839]